MKKILLIAAVTMMSTSAIASKARLSALGTAKHLSDFSDIRTKPDQAMNHADTALFELGDATTNGNTVATSTKGLGEAGFVRKMDNSAWGLYLNNHTTSASTYRSGFLGTENAMNLVYAMGMGDMTVGAGLYYSKSARSPETASAATPKATQDAMGLYVSAESKAGWDAQFGLGLANNAKIDVGAGDTKLTGKTTFSLSGGYHMDTMYFYGSYASAGAKVENTAGTATTDRADNTMALGVINSHKKDGSDFFYGISYSSRTLKDDATGATSLGAGISKNELTTMPVIIGMEVEATSWLTVRGSVTQNFFLMGSNKSSTTTGTAAKIDNGGDTTVAGGLGLKFGKLMVDGALAANNSTTGAFGSDNNFIMNTGLTYVF